MNITRPTCPCKGCPERHFNCHGRCERYQTWRKGYEEFKHYVDSQREQFTTHPEKMRLIKRHQMGKR